MTHKALQPAQHRADRNRQKQIGNALIRLYAEDPAQPVPEDLLQLLAEADRRLALNKKPT